MKIKFKSPAEPVSIPVVISRTDSTVRAACFCLRDRERKGSGMLSFISVRLGIMYARVQVPVQLAGRHK